MLFLEKIPLPSFLAIGIILIYSVSYVMKHYSKARFPLSAYLGAGLSSAAVNVLVGIFFMVAGMAYFENMILLSLLVGFCAVIAISVYLYSGELMALNRMGRYIVIVRYILLLVVSIVVGVVVSLTCILTAFTGYFFV